MEKIKEIAKRLFALLGDYGDSENYPPFTECEDDIQEMVHLLMKEDKSYTFELEDVDTYHIWDSLDGGMNSEEEVISRITSMLDQQQCEQSEYKVGEETLAEMSGHGYWDFFDDPIKARPCPKPRFI